VKVLFNCYIKNLFLHAFTVTFGFYCYFTSIVMLINHKWGSVGGISFNKYAINKGASEINFLAANVGGKKR
jgi:hypothetical protein